VSHQILHLKTIAELRAAAPAWDALWRACDVTIPTAQATLLEQWLVQFQATHTFHAVAVADDAGRFLAALPLVGRRLHGVLSAGQLASNAWTPAADLLLSPDAGDAVLERLAQGLSQIPWSILWLDFAIVSAERWQRLIAACQREGLEADAREHFRLPQIKIAGTWEAYRATWSRNHRQGLARARRKLEADNGPVRLRRLYPTSPGDIAALLEKGFAIEDRSWKGAAGSSVLRTPGMQAYLTLQATLLAERGQLEIAFLDVAERPLAFMYGWKAKQVFHAFKAGYDEAFASYSPGQLLFHDLLEDFFRTGEYRIFDCVGPVNSATARWQTRDYAAGRVVIAPPRWMGQAAFFAYKHLAPTLRRWRAAASATHATADRSALSS
jgi:CelD/BcsL family acetyltransferase involved in cellulose biosynthesis